jgi:hypothetical protein
MISDKVREEWISAMCRDHPRIPRFVIGELADTYGSDDGEWLKENKKRKNVWKESKQRKARENLPKKS